MKTFTPLVPAPSDPPEPFTDRLRLAVAAYLARFKGSSREHTESDLRCYLSWCTERGLDSPAAHRPHLELYIRWMQEIRRFKPSTVSRRFSVAAGFYRTCVVDGILEHSLAEHVRRPAVPAESPTPGFTHLQFEALLTAARQSPNPYDFALVAMLGLLGLRIFDGPGVVGQVDPGRPRRRAADFRTDGFRIGVRDGCAPGLRGQIGLPGGRAAISPLPDAGDSVPARRRRRLQARRGLRPHDPGQSPSRNRRLEPLFLARRFAPGCLGTGPRLPDRVSIARAVWSSATSPPRSVPRPQHFRTGIRPSRYGNPQPEPSRPRRGPAATVSSGRPVSCPVITACRCRAAPSTACTGAKPRAKLAPPPHLDSSSPVRTRPEHPLSQVSFRVSPM
jgi:hypothetical protein